MSLDWNGEAVERNLKRATKAAMDDIASDCVDTAKGLVNVDTTALQGSIQSRPAEERGGSIVVLWGSFSINYALWQEILPPERGGKAYLRPSADKHYPKLRERIAQWL